jgi:hypothetical protein
MRLREGEQVSSLAPVMSADDEPVDAAEPAEPVEVVDGDGV